jgi:3-oxoacyl-[acyl-carrier-protein] synthase-3
LIYVHGLGHFHPQNVLDNAFFEALDIGTSDEWILERTGIEARRTVLPLDYIRQTYNQDVRAAFEASLYDDIETARRAAAMAIERARISATDIGLILFGSSCSSGTAPAQACLVAESLGLSGVPALDINSACSTFGAQLWWLSTMVQEAFPTFVLMIQADNLTRVVDYRDRSSAVLFGDCTTAAVLSRCVPAPIAARSIKFGTVTTGAKKIAIPRVGHFRQEGRAVQTFAIRKTSELVEAMKADVNRGVACKFIGHQANLLMLEAVCRSCRIPASNHYFNVTTFGNTGAAGAPAVLSQRWEEWRTGDEILLAIVGAGYTYASAHLSVGVHE